MTRSWLSRRVGRHHLELPDFHPPESVTSPAPLKSRPELGLTEHAHGDQGTSPGTIDVELVGSATPLTMRLRSDLVECTYAGSAVGTFHRTELSTWLRRPRGRLVGDGMTWVLGGTVRDSVSVSIGYSVAYEVPLGQLRRLQAAI